MSKPRAAAVDFRLPFTLSHPALLVPRPPKFKPREGEKPKPAKYQCAAIFQPGDDLSPLMANAQEAKKLFFGNAPTRGLRSPFIKNEEAWKEDPQTGQAIPEPGYTAGGIHIWLDAGDRVAPECVDQWARPITDASVLYPGCKCIAVVRASGYDFEGMNRGVKFYLLTLQKVAEGENIAGRVSAKDYYKPVEGLDGGAATGATTNDGFQDDDPNSF